jgi:hypothetical protein
MLDEHPNSAISLRAGDKKENYREFYESFMPAEIE